MTNATQESSRPDREFVMPSNLNFLAPVVVNGLIRVGRENDGGYVIPDSLIGETDFLVSLGISEDWSFDAHFKKLNPGILIHAYDYTISEKVFLNRLRKAVIKMFLGRASFNEVRERLRLLKSYRAFFKDSITHFEERVRNRVDLPMDATLDMIFARTNSDKIFLKIDIEGGEYRIIDDIFKYADRIIGMVIEFHDTDPLRLVFAASVKKLQERFEIVHLHVNNDCAAAGDCLPEVLELTFMTKSGCPAGSKRKELPIPLLDSPNLPNLPDYKIKFNC